VLACASSFLRVHGAVPISELHKRKHNQGGAVVRCAVRGGASENSPSSLAGALLTELPLVGAEVERLDMPPVPFLEKHVEYVVGCLEDLSAEQSKLHYYQRSLQRQLAQQAAWIQKRKAENAARKHNGEELLAETDANNPIFKPLPEPPHLDSLLIENHIDLFCTQLNRNASQSLAKLHFLETLLSQ